MDPVFVYFTEAEARVLGKMACKMAKDSGEDVVGVLMSMGAFFALPGDKLVELAKRLELLANADP